ncbi:hypothetical protein PN467_17625 [Microcystis aeruginosa CS-563/04]|jgi:hypothetical protein|uniref:hypothetical protein n=1 Tax=Microcystis aeruginosa TaxID=1126 RepID=UPI00232E2043|nr:hypothetical protein [Microcystis aeruginosa]MDB9422277.1 hypothetical protein [Microcystis aeruginosa CS-563/04]
MKLPNSQNLLIASLLGLSTLFANSYPLVKAQSAKNVPFEVCFNSDTFVRPTVTEQVNIYKKVGRYSDLNITPQVVTSNPLWTENFRVWTSKGDFGALLIGDTKLHSGLWVLRDPKNTENDPVFDCTYKLLEFKDKSLTKITLWFMFYKVKTLQWNNNRFSVVVEPRNKGFQAIVFNKNKPHPENLIFEIFDTKGKLLGKCSNSCQLKK